MDRPTADWRGLLADLAAVGAVAAFLVAIHVLVPADVREGFALAYASPDPFYALTAAYVHLGDAHLRGNVVGYVLAGSVAAMLAHLADARRWFRLTSLAFLTVLPIGVGLTTAALVGGDVVGRGFSGVVAAYVGFLVVSPGVVLPRTVGTDTWVGWNAAAGLIVVVGAEVLWVFLGAIDPAVAGVLAAGLLLVVGRFVRPALDGSAWPADREGWVELARAAVVVAATLVVVTVFVLGLFPADFVDERSWTNVPAHYLGVVYGGVVAAWGSRYWVPPR